MNGGMIKKKTISGVTIQENGIVRNSNGYIIARLSGVDFDSEYINECDNKNDCIKQAVEITQRQAQSHLKSIKMELIITKISQSMFYGGFVVETNNEKEWFDLMKINGLWLNDENRMSNRVASLEGEIKTYE